MAVASMNRFSSRIGRLLGMVLIAGIGCAPATPPPVVTSRPAATAVSAPPAEPQSESELYQANAAKLHALMRQQSEVVIQSIDHRIYHRGESKEYEADLIVIMNGSTKPFDFVTEHGLRKLSDGVYGASVYFR